MTHNLQNCILNILLYDKCHNYIFLLNKKYNHIIKNILKNYKIFIFFVPLSYTLNQTENPTRQHCLSIKMCRLCVGRALLIILSTWWASVTKTG